MKLYNMVKSTVTVSASLISVRSIITYTLQQTLEPTSWFTLRMLFFVVAPLLFSENLLIQFLIKGHFVEKSGTTVTNESQEI